MIAAIPSATLFGVEGRPVAVEVHVSNGLPGFTVVGLPDAACRESRDRVRAALLSSGLPWPLRRVTVNLAPSGVRKGGAGLDLPIAIGLLVASGQLPAEAVESCGFLGELGLDGSLRRIPGVVALVDAMPVGAVVVPAACAEEAALVGRHTVRGVGSLSALVDALKGVAPWPRSCTRPRRSAAKSEEPDLRDVRGQRLGRRALEVAAAGAHHLLFIGPPGSGKTMLARRLPGILPPLTLAESIAVTKIHSLVAEEPPAGLLRERPFRSPHTGTSTAGMIGGGPLPRPGEASLAHNGVLFPDELPEFRRDTLEALRQPLEEGLVSVVRARAHLLFPARFSLLAAMNPCPCGHLGDPRYECRCSPPLVERYRGRVSGPLLDRVDLHVEVPAVTLRELRGTRGEPTAAVARRVEQARALQGERFGRTTTPINAAMGPDALSRHCAVDPAGRALLDAAFEKLGLSARALDRILKVARTIADLGGGGQIRAAHLAEAIQYRSLDRRVTL